MIGREVRYEVTYDAQTRKIFSGWYGEFPAQHIVAWLSGHMPGIDDSFAEQQIGERHAAWGKRLPDEPEVLWTFIHGLWGAERLDLLAHCADL